MSARLFSGLGLIALLISFVSPAYAQVEQGRCSAP